MKNPFGYYCFLFVIVAIALTSIIPALMAVGFMGKNLMPSPRVATLIALGGGAVAGAFSHPKRLISGRGMIVGIVYNLSALWALLLYARWGHSALLTFELAFPLVVALLPAVGVYYVLKIGRRPQPRDADSQPT